MLHSIGLVTVAFTLRVSYVLAERPLLRTAGDFVLAPRAKQCPDAQVESSELPSSTPAKDGWKGVWSHAQSKGKELFKTHSELREHGEGQAELAASLVSTYGGPLAPYAWGIAYLTKNVLFYVYCNDPDGGWQLRVQKLIVAIKDASDKYVVFQSDKCGEISEAIQLFECGSAVTVSVMSVMLSFFESSASSMGLKDNYAPALALLTDFAASIQKLWTEGATPPNILDFVANFMRFLAFGTIVISTGSTDAWYIVDAADNLLAQSVDTGIEHFKALLGDENALSNVHGTPKSLDIKPLGEQCMFFVSASMLNKLKLGGHRFVLMEPEQKLNGGELDQLDQLAFAAFVKSHHDERTYEDDIVGRFDAWEKMMVLQKGTIEKLMIAGASCKASYSCASVQPEHPCDIICDAAEWVCGSYGAGKVPGDSGWYLPTGKPPLSDALSWELYAATM